MARLDRAALDAAAFPLRFTLPTRFDDLDPLGHVNNAAAVVLLQEARVAFGREAGVSNLGNGLRLMAVGLVVEFAGEMRFPEPVEILVGCARVGRSSYTLAQLARQDGRTAIYAEATMACADDNGSAALPDTIRARLASFAVGAAR